MQPFPINEKIEKIKNDDNEISRFVEEYKPFIASCAQKVTGRYLKYGEDDELSIAMLAFVEAVRSFDSDKGKFFSLAQNIIRRRIIDYYRKENRHGGTISLDAYYGDHEEERDLSANESIRQFQIDSVSEARKLEIEELKKELSQWDISFSDLVDSSPKHGATKKISRDIIGFLTSNEAMLSVIMNKKYLPVTEIEKALHIPRKKIERLRKYIIAAVIIHTGDYQYIQEYLNN